MDGQCRKVNKIWFYGVGNTSKFTKDFVKDYNKDSDKEHFLEVDTQYPKKLRNLDNVSPFLPERMETANLETLVANLHDKE